MGGKRVKDKKEGKGEEGEILGKCSGVRDISKGRVGKTQTRGDGDGDGDGDARRRGDK